MSGQQACNWEVGDEPDPNQYCLYTVLDGDIVDGLGIVSELANQLKSGSFDGGYVITTRSFEEAQEVSRQLRRGALPTAVEVERLGQ